MTTLAFVGALLARWDRRVVAPRPLGRIFLQRPPAVRPSRTLQFLVRPGDVHVHLRPQISLILVRNHDAAEPGRSVPSRGPVAAGGLVLRTNALLQSERLLERVLARGLRVDVNGAPVAAATVPTPGRPALEAGRTQAAELVVRRTEVVSSASAAGAPAETVGRTGTPSEIAAALARATARAEAVVDVGRLTDQVVAAIDRRLVAQAERLGRA